MLHNRRKAEIEILLAGKMTGEEVMNFGTCEDNLLVKYLVGKIRKRLECFAHFTERR